MQFQTNIQKLKKAVLDTEKCTGKNLSLPVLSNILIIASGNEVKIRSTNLSIGVEITIDAKVKKEGVVLVRGDIFSSFLSNSISSEVVDCENKDGVFIVKTKTNTVSLKTFSHEDFPTLPIIKDSKTYSLQAKDLINGIQSVLFATATSDIKPEISSVYIYTENKTLFFVATDSFRLAEKKIQIKEELPNILIPYKNATELIRLFNESNTITITISETLALFVSDGIRFTTRLTSGIFPDYRQIIPKESSTEVIILKQDLQSALKLGAVFSDKFNQITVSVSGKEDFIIEAENQDVGQQKTVISGKVQGEDVSVHLNHRYITDMLSIISSDSLVFSFMGSQKPIIIRGVSDTSYIYLVMPMNR